MDQDQDRRLSMQFAQPVTASDLEEVDQPDVDVSHGLAGYVSGPSTPLSLMEDRKKSHEEAVRNIDDPVYVKAKFLLAVTDKDQDDSSSMRSFGSLEDLLNEEQYKVESAPKSPDELPEPQESELTEVSTADHCSEISELIADNESDDELNATVVAAQGAQPSVADASAIETMWIVHPHGELNQAVAETSDELLEIVEERVPHTNLSPEAIVNEVEAVQVAVPVEPHGVFSIMILFGKNRYLLTKDNGTSLRLVHTNEDDTVRMIMQDDQEVPLTTPFPFDTTFVGNGTFPQHCTSGTNDSMQTLHENAAITQPQNQEVAK